MAEQGASEWAAQSLIHWSAPRAPFELSHLAREGFAAGFAYAEAPLLARIEELEAALPSNTLRVTSEERAAQLRGRRIGVDRRFRYQP